MQEDRVEQEALRKREDPDAEAWIFIALGLLTMADRVLDGVMRESWPSIRESRVRWMTGRTLD